MCRPWHIENKFVNRKLEKGVWSVPRAPVIYFRILYSLTFMSQVWNQNNALVL